MGFKDIIQTFYHILSSVKIIRDFRKEKQSTSLIIQESEKTPVEVATPSKLTYDETVGLQIKQLREEHLKMSLGDFARRIDIQEVRYLEAIEQGRCSELSLSCYTQRICEEFNVKIEWLEGIDGFNPFKLFGRGGSCGNEEGVRELLVNYPNAIVYLYREDKPSTAWHHISALIQVKTDKGDKYYPFRSCCVLEGSGGGLSNMRSLLRVLAQNNEYSLPFVRTLPQEIYWDLFNGKRYGGSINPFIPMSRNSKDEHFPDGLQVDDVFTPNELHDLGFKCL